MCAIFEYYLESEKGKTTEFNWFGNVSGDSISVIGFQRIDRFPKKTIDVCIANYFISIKKIETHTHTQFQYFCNNIHSLNQSIALNVLLFIHFIIFLHQFNSTSEDLLLKAGILFLVFHMKFADLFREKNSFENI